MADTLQEFLVSLKYKAVGESDFLTGIKTAENTVMRLGKAFVTGGLAIGIFASKYAQRMEQVGFVARRTGTHVKNLMAFEQAGASLGSSAEGAQSSLEGLAAFLRNTPGARNFLSDLGVQTKDMHGHALDTVNVIENLGKAFQRMPTYMAHQYAGILGISENMMLALRSGKMPGLVSRFKKPLEGTKLDKVALEANTAMINARVFGMKKEAVEAKTMLPVLTSFNKADVDTKGLSTGMLGLAKTLSEVTVATMLFKGVLKTVFGVGAAEATEGATARAAGKVGGLGRLVGGGLKLAGAGVAGYAGWETGGWIRKNIPAMREIGDRIGDDVFSVLRKFHIIPTTEIVHANPVSQNEIRQQQVHHHNQTIHIQVDGSKDPGETARRVKQEIRMSAHNSSMATH